MLSYSEIRKMSPIGDFRSHFLVDHICMRISPILSAYFIEKKIKPNTITMFMILSGIIGSIFFACPSGISKILGIIFFYCWYIFDCSDGEVARITKTFSKYGREMDYMAHLICHPLMNLAMFCSFLQLNKYNQLLLAAIFITYISFELITRIIIMFDVYCLDKKNNPLTEQTSFFKYFIVQFSLYPNFILLFPLLYILDYYGYITSIYVLLTFVGIHFLLYIKQIWRFLLFFYRS